MTLDTLHLPSFRESPIHLDDIVLSEPVRRKDDGAPALIGADLSWPQFASLLGNVPDAGLVWKLNNHRHVEISMRPQHTTYEQTSTIVEIAENRVTVIHGYPRNEQKSFELPSRNSLTNRLDVPHIFPKIKQEQPYLDLVAYLLALDYVPRMSPERQNSIVPFITLQFPFGGGATTYSVGILEANIMYLGLFPIRGNQWPTKEEMIIRGDVAFDSRRIRDYQLLQSSPIVDASRKEVGIRNHFRSAYDKFRPQPRSETVLGTPNSYPSSGVDPVTLLTYPSSGEPAQGHKEARAAGTIDHFTDSEVTDLNRHHLPEEEESTIDRVLTAIFSPYVWQQTASASPSSDTEDAPEIGRLRRWLDKHPDADPITVETQYHKLLHHLYYSNKLTGRATVAIRSVLERLLHIPTGLEERKDLAAERAYVTTVTRIVMAGMPSREPTPEAIAEGFDLLLNNMERFYGQKQKVDRQMVAKTFLESFRPLLEEIQEAYARLYAINGDDAKLTLAQVNGLIEGGAFGTKLPRLMQAGGYHFEIDEHAVRRRLTVQRVRGLLRDRRHTYLKETDRQQYLKESDESA